MPKLEHFYQNVTPPHSCMFTYPKLYSYAVSKAQKHGTLVEIGCWVGQSMAYLAVEAINADKDLQLYAVDTFVGNLHHGSPPQNFPQWNQFSDNLKPVWEHIHPVIGLSDVCSGFFEDKSCDFIFIDADHSFEAVTRDLNAWWPKLKPAGIFAGHDIKHPPVKQAVDNFVKKYNLNYYVDENCWVVDLTK